MSQKRKRHENSLVWHIIKKYKNLNLKIAELINYVYRKSIYFNKKYQSLEEVPKLDILAFFDGLIKAKKEKKISNF